MVERIAYTPKEACEALRIGRTKLYELFAQQKLKAVALGGKTLILRAEVERFLSELPSIPLQNQVNPASKAASSK
jgi:excisionase family DNA binding protein